MGVKIHSAFSSAIVEVADELVAGYVAQGWVEVKPTPKPEVKKQDAKPSVKK